MQVGSSLNIYRSWQIGEKENRVGGGIDERAEKDLEMVLLRSG